MELLGEENNKRIKDKVTDFIIQVMKDDIEDYGRYNYVLNPEDIIEFVDECKKEAFTKMKEDTINRMMKKIEESL